MAGFASMDDFINKVSSLGQFYRADWNKNFLPTTPAVAGEWFCLARGAGNPGADALFNTGTNLVFQPNLDTTANGTSIQHGGNVGPAYKSLVNASSFSAAATTMPSVAMLVDLIGWYRVTTTTTTSSQATTNTLNNFCNWTTDGSSNILTSAAGLATGFAFSSFINLKPYTRIQVSNSGGGLPTGLSAVTDYYVISLTDTTIKLATSYANAVAGTAITISSAGTGTQTLLTLYPRYTNGAGVQSFWWANNATPLGAGTPNLSYPNYTNAAQTTGKTTPTVLPIGKTAAANGIIIYSGTGNGKYGPFFPLAAGDTGIAKIDNVQISSTYTSGEFSVAVCKPLLTLPMTTIGVAGERDLMNQVPSLPRIYDSAALYWLLYNGVNTPVNSAFAGHLDFAWS